MVTTGVVRRVDDLGRIVIPMELRRSLGIQVKDPLSISVEGDKIVLQKYRDACIICGSERLEGDVVIKGKHVCGRCRTKLQASSD